ncbi:MAG: hypothetical protein QW117_01170 [Candidatus Pacearchaeota archaeon]
MEEKILIINLCYNNLHYYEFVKPVEDIIKITNKKYKTIYYKKLNQNTIKRFKKIILCGTSLKDNEYFENIKNFEWIKNYNGKILGICAGMQILCKIFNCNIEKNLDIGLKLVNFKKNFLGIEGWKEVYELHNYEISFSSVLEREFEIFSQGSIDALKHKNKEFYVTLFHPEVNQKEIIINFVNLK